MKPKIIKVKIIKVKEAKKKEYFQKCVVCKSKLGEHSIREPFSVNSVIGQEPLKLFDYLHCIKCGLMYQKSAQTLKKEKDEKEGIGFGIFSGGTSSTNPFGSSCESPFNFSDEFSPVSDFTHKGSGGF